MNSQHPSAPRPSMLCLDTEPTADGAIRVTTDRSYWNFTSAFGGWLTGVAINIVRGQPDVRGEIITQQTQFIAPASTDAIDVTVRRLARRTSIDFWRTEMAAPDGRLLATSDITMGIRRSSRTSFEDHPPADGDGDDPGTPIEVTDLHPTWMAKFAQVMLVGEPLTINERPRSLMRCRPLEDVRFDSAVLAMICDSPMPRIFFAGTELAFASTLSLSTHIYACDEDIAAVGRQFVLVEADSAVIRNNTLNQEVRVFRDDGLLLACSYQTAVYKPAS